MLDVHLIVSLRIRKSPFVVVVPYHRNPKRQRRSPTATEGLGIMNWPSLTLRVAMRILRTAVNVESKTPDY